MKLRNYSKKIKTILFILGLLSIVAFLWLSLNDFMLISNSHAKSTVKVQLSELAVQTAAALKSEINSTLSTVKSSAAAFSQFDDLHSKEALDCIEAFAADSVFDLMCLTTPDGVSYASGNNIVNISERMYFKNTMSGESGITSEMTSLYNGELVFVVYAPITRNSQVIGGIHGVYGVKRLLSTIQVGNFNGQSYSSIFKRDGSIIIKSDTPNSLLEDEKNIWPFLKGCEYKEAYSYNTMYEKVQNNESGFIEYNNKSNTHTAYYTPIGINNWYLLEVIPETVISDHTDIIDKTAVLLTVKILIVLGVIIVGILIYSGNSRKIILKANRDFQMNNQRLKIAMSHNTNIIFEFDPVTSAIEVITQLPPDWRIPQIIPGGYQEMIDKGYIDPEFAEEIKSSFKQIINGAKVATCISKIWYKKEHFAWNKIALTNIFDEKGRAIRAIGTVEDITEAKETELRYAKEERYRNAMLSDALDVYEIDVTTSTIELPNKNKMTGEASLIGMDYNTARKRFANNSVHLEDREGFLHMSDPATIVSAYQNHDTHMYFEYRRIDMNEEPVWVSSTTNALKDPSTGDIKAFIYLKNIDMEKKKELALKYQAERDSLVGIYNRVTAQKLITEFLESSSISSVHGFLTIDLDSFKSVNDKFGHMTGDNVLKQVGELLSGIFRATDVVARLGGDEFIVFQKNVHSRLQVEVKALEVCKAFRKINVSPDYHVSGSVGIAVTHEDGSTFEELYKKSDIALYYAKSNGKDCFASYSSKMEGIENGEEKSKEENLSGECFQRQKKGAK